MRLCPHIILPGAVFSLQFRRARLLSQNLVTTNHGYLISAHDKYIMSESIIVAIILDTLQDLFEWLPIFSEGNITIILAAFGGQPSDTVTLGLFLYHGTTVSVTVCYRITVHELINLGMRVS